MKCVQQIIALLMTFSSISMTYCPASSSSDVSLHASYQEQGSDEFIGPELVKMPYVDPDSQTVHAKCSFFMDFVRDMRFRLNDQIIKIYDPDAQMMKSVLFADVFFQLAKFHQYLPPHYVKYPASLSQNPSNHMVMKLQILNHFCTCRILRKKFSPGLESVYYFSKLLKAHYIIAPFHNKIKEDKSSLELKPQDSRNDQKHHKKLNNRINKQKELESESWRLHISKIIADIFANNQHLQPLRFTVSLRYVDAACPEVTQREGPLFCFCSAQALPISPSSLIDLGLVASDYDSHTQTQRFSDVAPDQQLSSDAWTCTVM